MTEPGYTRPDLTLLGVEHVRLYRETNGKIGHEWNGVYTLLLTTVGRLTGEPRTSPMIYGRNGADYVVIASQGGLPTHPNWYHNLTTNPEVEVQVGAERFGATARVVEGEERTQLWNIMVAQWPNYDVYASRTERRIPVVVLQRRSGRADSSRSEGAPARDNGDESSVPHRAQAPGDVGRNDLHARRAPVQGDG